MFFLLYCIVLYSDVLCSYMHILYNIKLCSKTTPFKSANKKKQKQQLQQQHELQDKLDENIEHGYKMQLSETESR